MTLLELDLLDDAVPQARFEDLVRYIAPLNEAMERCAIDTPRRIAAFVAQLAHESGNFRQVEENLNYSWHGLRRTWPGRFPTDEIAMAYHRQPEMIANRAYGGRNGNGDESSGDGWKYRGRGLIQVTFRNNYVAYGRHIGDESLIADPSQLVSPRHAAWSACWYWASRGLNELADLGTEEAFNQISFRINGGWNGKAGRLESWAQASEVITA